MGLLRVIDRRSRCSAESSDEIFIFVGFSVKSSIRLLVPLVLGGFSQCTVVWSGFWPFGRDRPSDK